MRKPRPSVIWSETKSRLQRWFASGGTLDVGEPTAPPVPRERPPRAARLEIGLPSGIKLKVDAGVDPKALAAIVGVLQRR